MKEKGIKERQAYHDRKAKELDKLTDVNQYTRKLKRIMKYHSLLSELEAAEVKKILKGDEEMKKSKMSIVELRVIEGLKRKKRLEITGEAIRNLEVFNTQIRNLFGVSEFVKRDVIKTKELEVATEYKLSALLIILEESLHEMSDTSETLSLLFNSIGQQKDPHSAATEEGKQIKHN